MDKYISEKLVSRQTVYNHIATGKIPIVIISDRVFVYVEDVKEEETTLLTIPIVQ